MSLPKVETNPLLVLRDQAISSGNPYMIHAKDIAGDRNIIIDSRNGPVVWDDANELVHAVLYNSTNIANMSYPIMIQSLEYASMSFIEIFYS